MQEYWNEIKIADIKKIGGISRYSVRGETFVEFNVTMKDKSIHNMNFKTKSEVKNYGELKRKELLKLYNEQNNIPETYLLENDIFLRVNDKNIHFGVRCVTILDEYVYLTNKEIEELRKGSKIKNEGWRHLLYIQPFIIKENKIDRPIPQRYIDQLEYMGYDVSELEYEISAE